MTLKLLLCGDGPDGAWNVQRMAQALESATPELERQVEVEIVRVNSAGEALKASGAFRFDMTVAALPLPDGMPKTLRPLGSLAIAILKDKASFNDAILHGAADVVCAGPDFDGRLDSALRAAARRIAIAKSSFDLGMKRDLPFLAMLSHELKSPLSTVDGYLRMLDARESGDALSSYDHMIKRSLLRLESMHKLIGDIVDLARAESGGLKRKLEPVDLKGIWLEAMGQAGGAAKAKDVSLHCEMPEGLTFNSFPGDLRAIVSNLVSNAVKYNRAGGSVNLSISKNDGILKLKVSDTGIGIAPEELVRLDGEFARVRNSDTRDIPGSGLGLSIVRRIASLYGGVLSMESRRGKGSSFTVELREPPPPEGQ